jgi:hypothetical protein
MTFWKCLLIWAGLTAGGAFYAAVWPGNGDWLRFIEHAYFQFCAIFWMWVCWRSGFFDGSARSAAEPT